MYIVRTVKDGIYEIALAYLLFQHTIQIIRKIKVIGRYAVVKGNIITAAAQLVVALSALTVGIQPVPPCNYAAIRSGKSWI